MKSFALGKIGGVEIRAAPRAAIGLIALWIVVGGFGIIFLGFSALEGVLFGVAAAFFHFASGILHHLGHALFARATGYPMQAVELGRMFILAVSRYPDGEPELPGRVHIRRAIGGPVMSFAISLLLGVATLTFEDRNSLVFWLSRFVFWDNLLVYGLGVLLPLGFTDMSTIVRWWGK